MFPHHDNEIAQSEAATGCHFVNTWMHNGPVRVDNEKMSKSLNNFFTIREVLKLYPAEVIRYFLVSSHYRSHINYSEENLQTALSALQRFYQTLKNVEKKGAQASLDTDFEIRFHAAMQDDFNTPEALGIMFELARETNRLKDSNPDDAVKLAALLRKLGAVIGILSSDATEFLRSGNADVEPFYIDDLLLRRNLARAEKNWLEADKIRDELKALNVVVEDRDGVSSWRIDR